MFKNGGSKFPDLIALALDHTPLCEVKSTRTAPIYFSKYAEDVRAMEQLATELGFAEAPFRYRLAVWVGEGRSGYWRIFELAAQTPTTGRYAWLRDDGREALFLDEKGKVQLWPLGGFKKREKKEVLLWGMLLQHLDVAATVPTATPFEAEA